MGRYGVDPCPGEAQPTKDATDGVDFVVAFVTLAALAISAWLLESLISALVPAMVGEVAESEP